MHVRVTLTETMPKRDNQKLLWFPSKISVKKIEKNQSKEEDIEWHSVSYILFESLRDAWREKGSEGLAD